MSSEKKSIIITFMVGVFLLSVFIYQNSLKYFEKILNFEISQKITYEKEGAISQVGKNLISTSTATSTKEAGESTSSNEAPSKTPEPKEIKRKQEEEINFKKLEEDLLNAQNLLNSIKEGLNSEDNTPEENSQNYGSFSSLNTEVRKSLVNIICTTKSGGAFKPISGSGVFISPKGVVLTNAHIGQYFLLKDYPNEGYVDCAIRVGAPAQNKYKARLLYISNQWVKQNSDIITSNNPTGTGKDDYAFLLITEPASEGVDLPESFEYTPSIITDSHINTGEDMLIAAYTSGFLGGIIIQKELYPSSAVDEVEKLYTFEAGTLDLFEFVGNIIAQKGSSGGAAVDERGLLSGIVVTSSQESQTGERAMRAITISHINRSLEKEGGFSLSKLLNSDLEKTANEFNEIVFPKLKSVLVESIEN